MNRESFLVSQVNLTLSRSNLSRKKRKMLLKSFLLIGVLVTGILCTEDINSLSEEYHDNDSLSEEDSHHQLENNDERIVGGQEANIKDYPWQVSIQRGNSHLCGGSLYSKDIVITAAHCIDNATTEYLQVRLGSAKFNEGGQLVQVAEYRIHEDYNSSTYEHDIALVRLATPVTLNRQVKTIKLARRIPTFRTNAIVTGWGSTRAGSYSTSSILQAANVKLIRTEDCASKTYGYGALIKPGMICAYAQGKDACEGDSGGPLINRGRLIGVVSWDRGCATANLLGVYSDIVHYKPWIYKTLKEF